MSIPSDDDDAAPGTEPQPTTETFPADDGSSEQSAANDVSADDARAPDTAGGAVNSQILDAVSAINALTTGLAPANSAAMLGLSATHAIALGMYGALTRQQSDATIGSAAVAAACARIIGATRPSVDMPAGDGDLIATIETQAQAGILTLRALAAGTGDDADAARGALARLATAATDPAASPPPVSAAENVPGTQGSQP